MRLINWPTNSNSNSSKQNLSQLISQTGLESSQILNLVLAFEFLRFLWKSLRVSQIYSSRCWFFLELDFFGLWNRIKHNFWDWFQKNFKRGRKYLEPDELWNPVLFWEVPQTGWYVRIQLPKSISLQYLGSPNLQSPISISVGKRS